MELSFEDFMKNQEVVLFYPLKNFQSKISVSTSMETDSPVCSSVDAQQLKNQARIREKKIVELKNIEIQKMKMEAIHRDLEKRRRIESQKVIQAACRGYLARRRIHKLKLLRGLR